MNPDRLERSFRFFASMCEGRSPLYAALSARIAEDPEVLALASGYQPGQPPVNLLFGAVQHLLLGGARHPLAAFYPSVGGREPPEGAYPAFVDFCGAHRAEVVERVQTRRVQTNEVGRSGTLLPAFGIAAANGRPLHLIEVGASLGLNLLFDRYRYEYSDGRTLGPESAPIVRTEVRGETPLPLPERLPDVSGRVGIDIAPVDPADDDAVRWIEALIWPDQVHRHVLFRSALTLARRDPPRVVAGEGMALLPDLLEEVSSEATPCVFHTHAIYQMDEAWRGRFGDLLADLGRRRGLARVSIEWLGDQPGPQVHLTRCSGGTRETVHLATCGDHGEWVRWIAVGD